MNEPSASSPKKKNTGSKYPMLAVRFWHGMRFSEYIRMLAANRFRVGFLGLGMALFILFFSPLNSFLSILQSLIYSKRIKQTKIRKSPVFILGHWRSGTTLLHELLGRDPHLAYPDTFECFSPHHFLITGPTVPKLFGFILPNKRPMDAMETGFQRPQEDEFAIMGLGGPTPYLRMAFPNQPPPYEEFYDMQGVAASDRQRFENAIVHFVKTLTYLKKKRLVMKSPPHTGRIATLAEIFPEAKFIHLVRSPFEMIPSTIRLWKMLDRTQGFQIPKQTDQEVEDFAFRIFKKIYGGYYDQSQQFGPDQLYEMRFEDLISKPLETIEKAYNQLNIGDFSQVEPAIKTYFENQKDYSRNTHEIDDRLKARIADQCRDYIQRSGYEVP